MNGSHDLDVSALPTIAIGPRAPLWWAQSLMMAIEGTIFALLVASYFYIRIGFAHWPTPNIAEPDIVLPTIGVILLLLSIPPLIWSGRSAEHHKRFGTIAGVFLNIACAVAFLIIRWTEFVRLDFKWNTDIYGSLVWTILGLHTMHAVADTVQTSVMFLIVLVRKTGEKQILGLKADAQYWYFVVAVWMPLYFIIYVYPRLAKW